jgi:16S rRNA (cytidine1402-2'-O)-methyltransferase
MALILSGFDASRFQCIGFLPRKSLEALRTAMGYPGTTVALESPERLLNTLIALKELDPERQVAVVREMTKTYEECKRGPVSKVLAHFQKKGVRGEICLVIAGGKLPVEEMPLDELIEQLQELHDLSLKEAVKLAAKLLKRPKSEIYKKVHY